MHNDKLTALTLQTLFNFVAIRNQVLVIIGDFTIEPSMSGVILEEVCLQKVHNRSLTTPPLINVFNLLSSLPIPLQNHL